MVEWLGNQNYSVNLHLIHVHGSMTWTIRIVMSKFWIVHNKKNTYISTAKSQINPRVQFKALAFGTQCKIEKKISNIGTERTQPTLHEVLIKQFLTANPSRSKIKKLAHLPVFICACELVAKELVRLPPKYSKLVRTDTHDPFYWVSYLFVRCHHHSPLLLCSSCMSRTFCGVTHFYELQIVWSTWKSPSLVWCFHRLHNANSLLNKVADPRHDAALVSTCRSRIWHVCSHQIQTVWSTWQSPPLRSWFYKLHNANNLSETEFAFVPPCMNPSFYIH